MPIQAGDVMIKISDGSAVSRVIQFGQAAHALAPLALAGTTGLSGVGKAARGLATSGYTHAGVASSANSVIEMGGTGLLENSLLTTNSHYDYAVFRCVHPEVCTGAAQTAVMMRDIVLAQPGAVTYTVFGAFKSLFKSKRMPPGSGDIASLMLDRVLAGGSGAKFFCSGFVVLCYQIVSSQMGILAPWAQGAFPVQEAGSLFSGKDDNYNPSHLFRTLAASASFQPVGKFRGDTYMGPV